MGGRPKALKAEGKAPSAEGTKDDAGKPRWWLVPNEAMCVVVDVLTIGAKRYGDNNWREVDDWRKRYYSAAQRHLVAWQMGQRNDPGDDKHHLAHAVCCLLFLLSLDLSEGGK